MYFFKVCFLAVLVIVVKSTNTIISYSFGSILGQVFNDFSGYFSVNGVSYLNTLKDTLPTDRGAYFSTGNLVNLITLPPNGYQGTTLYLTSEFSVAFWILSINDYDYYAFYHGSSSTDYFYIIRRHASSLIETRLIKGGIDTGVIKTPSNTFLSGI